MNLWEHKTPKVIESEYATILWDFNIHTDRTIKANRLDIVVKNHYDKIVFSLSVPCDTNVSLRIFEKLSKQTSK